MDDSFVGQFIPDRDNLAFSTAGILFSLGWWCYIFGVTSPSGVPEHPYQFDATSLFPGIVASLALITLNVFSTRRQLQAETWNLFQTSTSRMAKLMVFILFTLNLSSVGLAVVLGTVGYGSKGMPQTCFGLILQTLFIVASSFTIYFGRVLSESQFFDE